MRRYCNTPGTPFSRQHSPPFFCGNSCPALRIAAAVAKIFCADFSGTLLPPKPVLKVTARKFFAFQSERCTAEQHIPPRLHASCARCVRRRTVWPSCAFGGIEITTIFCSFDRPAVCAQRGAVNPRSPGGVPEAKRGAAFCAASTRAAGQGLTGEAERSAIVAGRKDKRDRLIAERLSEAMYRWV